jgi:flagellar protein FliS
MQAAANPYLRTRILTASSHELRLMLYDGALRYAQQGREALAQSRFEDSFNALSRCKRIVMELTTSLNHGVAPELTEKLGALYTFIYKLLVQAGLEHSTAQLDQAIELLQYQRETWRLLVEKATAPAAAGESPASSPMPTHDSDPDPSLDAPGLPAVSEAIPQAPSRAGAFVAGRLPPQAPAPWKPAPAAAPAASSLWVRG